MKKRGIVSLALLVLIPVLAFAAPIAKLAELDQQDTDDGDSTGAAADTSATMLIPLGYSGFYVTIVSDSCLVYTTQISKDAVTWWQVDKDTTVAATLESGPNLSTIYHGFYARVILDGLWTVGKKVTQVFYTYTK